MRLASLTAALLLLSACAAQPAPLTPPPAEPQPSNLPSVGMANPASVACGNVFGGELSIVSTPEGEIGMCRLPDGRSCEEWGLFRDNRCVSATGQVVPGPAPVRKR